MGKLKSMDFVYMGYCMVIVRHFLASTCFEVSDMAINLLMISAMLCFGQKLLYVKFRKHEFNRWIVFLISAMMIFVTSGSTDILVIGLFLLSIKDIDTDKCEILYTRLALIMFIIPILWSLLTGINLGVEGVFRTGDISRYRYTLGFSHPNAFHGAYFRLVCGMVLTDYWEDHRNLKYLFLELINIFIYSLSNSRAGLVSVTLVVVGMFGKNVLLKITRKKILLAIIEVISVSVIGFTIYNSMHYKKNSTGEAFDVFINGRFSQAYKFFMNYKLQLWGTDISEMAKVMPFDCGIANVLLTGGIIFFVLIVIVYVYGIYLMWKSYKYSEMIIVLAVIIYSMVENIFVNPFINIGLFFCLQCTFSAPSWFVKSKEERVNGIS